MTRLEEAVWAAAYVGLASKTFQSLLEKYQYDPGHYEKCVECADLAVETMRNRIKHKQRLHVDDQLERERAGADIPLYRNREG